MNKVFLLLFSSIILLASFSRGYDFGRGKFQMQGRIFIDSTLLKDETIHVLPFHDPNLPDTAHAEVFYINNNGDFKYTVNFITPCLSGGDLQRCINRGRTEDACWEKLFKGYNYQFLEFSCRKKKFRYNLVPHAMEEYFYEKNMDFKNVTPKTFTQDILLK